MSNDVKDRLIWLVVYVSIAAMLTMAISGCMYQQEDGSYKFGLSPKAANGIENAGETGVGILSILSTIFPALTGVAGVGGGLLAGYKKIKPELIKNKTVAEHVVTNLETLKQENPKLWQKVKTYLEENSNADIDATIDSIIALLEGQTKNA